MAEKSLEDIEQKSQSQRFRNTLYVLWEQRGSHGDFDAYYARIMERLIDIVKSKLEDKREEETKQNLGT